MKHPSGRHFPLSLSAILMSFSVFSLPVFSAAQKIRTENGIPVVYNPRDPVPAKGTPASLVLKQDLIIGQEAGDEKYMFSALRSVQVDNEGNIYALDSRETQIKVFDKEGKHLRTFGKKGQGPGEIQSPVGMHLTPHGQLAILDNRNRRIAFFSLTGECLKEVPSAKWNFIRTRVDSRSRIYADSMLMGDKSISLKLMKFDPELNLVATIGEVDMEIKPRKVNPMPDRFLYDIMRDDHLIWTFTDNYEIQIIDPEGKPVRKFIKDYDPAKITEEDKEKMIREVFGDKGIPQEVSLEFPVNYPPTNYMLVDDQDRIFVRTYLKDAQGNYYYDVFSLEGIYLLKFTLAIEGIPMAIKKDKMYCLIQEGEAGIPQINRYTLEWK